uniref:Alpha-macroglobulin receptor-binding domain-containing protein n=1 Tax=Phasianus colchicus TaxID=9054 RepID=A0A669QK07_PHACC
MKVSRALLPAVVLYSPMPAPCNGKKNSKPWASLMQTIFRCLQHAVHNITNTYTEAVLAYAFALAGDYEITQELLYKLEEQAIKSGGQIHWSPKTSSPASTDFWHTTQSVDIELTAYVLLAYLSKPRLHARDMKTAAGIVVWLTQQQNAYGGFASTQDTVISLQALAQYAALIPHEVRDVKVTVKGKETTPLEFHVHQNNKLVLHQASLLEVPGMYTVQATGSGCVYIQSTLYYNTPPPKAEVVFLLDVETVTRECDGVRKQFDIHLSVSYTGDRETSNMALVEVDMLSGFIPMKKSVKELENVLLVKKAEIKPDKVTIYLEEVRGRPHRSAQSSSTKVVAVQQKYFVLRIS